MVGIYLTHVGARLRYRLIYKEKDRLLGLQLNALANDPHELRYGDVVGHQELPLVDLGDLRVRHLLHHDRYALWVAGADLLRLGLSLLCKDIRLLLFKVAVRQSSASF